MTSGTLRSLRHHHQRKKCKVPLVRISRLYHTWADLSASLRRRWADRWDSGGNSVPCQLNYEHLQLNTDLQTGYAQKH